METRRRRRRKKTACSSICWFSCCCSFKSKKKKSWNAGVAAALVLLFLLVVWVQYSASLLNRKFFGGLEEKEEDLKRWNREAAAGPATNNKKKDELVVVVSSSSSSSHLSNNNWKNEEVDDLHGFSKSVVELLDWEIESVLEKPYYNQSSGCRVPMGVDEVCCLGTQSHTGKIKISRRHLCDHLSLEDYQQIRNTQQLQQQLQQSAHDDDDDEFIACDVCRIVELLRRRRGHPQQPKFAFLGDSLTNQVEQGMVCELQRRNYLVTQEQVDYNKRKGDPLRSIIEYRRRSVRSPLWPPNEPSVTIDFLFQYRLPLLYPEQRELIVNTYDILIFNMGLHWVYSYDKEEEAEDEGTTITTNKKKKKKKKTNRWTVDTLERHLEDFFTILQRTGKVRLLAYRETTATHFDAPGGDYSLARRTHPNFDASSCVPLRDDNEKDLHEVVSKWREPIVRQAARLANYSVIETGPYMTRKTNNNNNNLVDSNNNQQEQIAKEVLQPKEMYIIPYNDFTSSFWKMHPHREGPNAHLDCSHYCSSPYLFQPIWVGIRRAMDREFGG